MIDIYLIGTFLYFVFIIIYFNTKIIILKWNSRSHVIERPYVRFKLWEILLVIISFFIPVVNIIVPCILIMKGCFEAIMLGGFVKWTGLKSKLFMRIIKFLNKNVN